ncbi:MAG: hypothetical protein J5691_01285 [Bacilli bacterium]|nr:hypothetical protein [Bacilli bacterium]
MITNIQYPIRVISYYASSKSQIDGKNDFCFWMRSKLTRIVCDKSFARGDVLQINGITDTPSGILIDTSIVEEWEKEYPVLTFVSGRLIYNKWAEFDYTPSEGIQIIKPIEQILSDNYSIGFVLLVYQSGIIKCVDKITNNYFDIHVNLEWEQ